MMITNKFAALVASDEFLMELTDARQNYVAVLDDLVNTTNLDELPLIAPRGPASGLRLEMRNAVLAAGVSKKAAPMRVSRLVHVVHLLAAAPRKLDETEENFTNRVMALRTLANSGDASAIARGLKGEAVKGKRKTSTSSKSGGKKSATPRSSAAEIKATTFDVLLTEWVAISKRLRNSLDGGYLPTSAETKALIEDHNATAQCVRKLPNVKAA